MENKKPRLTAGRRILIQKCSTSVTSDENTMKISFLITGNGMKPKDFDIIFQAIENLCEELSNPIQAR